LILPNTLLPHFKADQDVPDPSLALILARDSALMYRDQDGDVLDNSRNTLIAAVTSAPQWKLNLPRSRHIDPVNSGRYSPDSQRFVTAGMDGTARIWDAETGIENLLVDEHTGQVWWAEFSPDGEHIVTAGDDGFAIIWPYSIDRLLEMTGPPIQRSIPELTIEEILLLDLFVE
jgi:WD40 repeat protein